MFLLLSELSYILFNKSMFFIKGSFYDFNKLSSICRLLLTDLSPAWRQKCYWLSAFLVYNYFFEAEEREGGRWRQISIYGDAVERPFPSTNNEFHLPRDEW